MASSQDQSKLAQLWEEYQAKKKIYEIELKDNYLAHNGQEAFLGQTALSDASLALKKAAMDAALLDYNTFKYQKNGITYGGEGKYLKYELTKSSVFNEDNKYLPVNIGLNLLPYLDDFFPSFLLISLSLNSSLCLALTCAPQR